MSADATTTHAAWTGSIAKLRIHFDGFWKKKPKMKKKWLKSCFLSLIILSHNDAYCLLYQISRWMILDMVIKNKYFSCFMVQTWNQSNCLMIASDPASFNLMSIDPENKIWWKCSLMTWGKTQNKWMKYNDASRKTIKMLVSNLWPILVT